MSFLRTVSLAERFPHDFTIQYPPRREFFQERYRGQPVPTDLLSIRRLLLYIHIPFCEAKCHYCNFAIDIRQDPLLHARYVEALVLQLDRLSDLLPQERVLAGIDIGGGTPTLLKPALLKRLLEALRPWRERAEMPSPISIETTPRIAADDPDLLSLLAEFDVDRISMGLQSTSVEVLTGINRGGAGQPGWTGFAELARAGFRRVNVDLIFGLPGQTKSLWRADLEQHPRHSRRFRYHL